MYAISTTNNITNLNNIAHQKPCENVFKIRTMRFVAILVTISTSTHNTRYAQKTGIVRTSQTGLFRIQIYFLSQWLNRKTIHDPRSASTFDSVTFDIFLTRYWVVVESQARVTAHYKLYTSLIAWCPTITPPPTHPSTSQPTTSLTVNIAL